MGRVGDAGQHFSHLAPVCLPSLSLTASSLSPTSDSSTQRLAVIAVIITCDVVLTITFCYSLLLSALALFGAVREADVEWCFGAKRCDLKLPDLVYLVWRLLQPGLLCSEPWVRPPAAAAVHAAPRVLVGAWGSVYMCLREGYNCIVILLVMRVTRGSPFHAARGSPRALFEAPQGLASTARAERFHEGSRVAAEVRPDAWSSWPYPP